MEVYYDNRNCWTWTDRWFFCKAYSDNDEHKVLAYNRSKEVIQVAYNDKAIDGELNEGNIKDCDLILLCLYPQLCIDYLTKMAPYICKDAW